MLGEYAGHQFRADRQWVAPDVTTTKLGCCNIATRINKEQSVKDAAT